MPNVTADADHVTRLIELLEEQAGLSDRLEQLAQQQRALVTEGRTDDLLGVLSQRQQLIGGLEAVSAKLGPYRSHWSDYWQSLSPAERDRVGPLVKRVQAGLARLMEGDDQDRAQLEATHSAVGEQLSRLSQSGAAHKAYTAEPLRPQSVLADRKG